MASLSPTKRNGKTCYQVWLGTDRNRRQIWLGSISKSQANELFSYVKQLDVAAQTGASVAPVVQQWLATTDDRFYDKLVKAGLVKPRCSRTVREFFAERLKKLDCSPRTRDIYQRAHDKYFEYLDGRNPLLRDVTPESAHDFYNVFLVEAEMADSYRNKTARIIREFFGRAFSFELTTRNPFEGFQISSDVDRIWRPTTPWPFQVIH